MPNTPADARSVLANLAVGVLTISSAGQVTFANPRAEAFFAPVEPAGLQLDTLLTRSGVCEHLLFMAAIEAHIPSPPIRICVASGIALDCYCTIPDDGSTLITLVDVTSYVREAESALRDPLTGLINRSRLNERLNELLGHSQRSASQLAILFLDLDRFKVVNDSLGHPLGDMLLSKVAERILSVTRVGDVVARIGGDEFVIVQYDAPQPRTAEAAGERLVKLIGQSYCIDGHILDIGVSIGVAVSPKDGNDSATLLKHADLALYRAKAEGRGAVRFFQPSMNIEIQERRSLELELRRGLALQEFELVYQPQIDIEIDQVTGFEALIRWHNPKRGVISPAQFIPLAEEIGLICQLGEWVLNTACLEAASWASPVFIAVNISPLQFAKSNLVQIVKAALATSGLEPARLELEITEGLLLDNSEDVLETLKTLKALGVQLSMDDFGTGYSSLSYLQKFPFDKIKIDGSLVRGFKANAGAIVHAVTALGESLGMKTIAEGVETIEQLERVRAAGCRDVQGYLTGRPESAVTAAARFNGPKPALKHSIEN